MAIGLCEAKAEQKRVMELFQQGRSKAVIGREIGKDKKAVWKIISQAIRGKANG